MGTVLEPGLSPGAQSGIGASHGSGEPVFAQPWQAHAFAIVLKLHERGLFTWTEWAQALATQIGLAQTAGDAGTGHAYYQHWLAALEGLVATKGAATAGELHSYRSAWQHAAGRTPHGQPIELKPADFDR